VLNSGIDKGGVDEGVTDGDVCSREKDEEQVEDALLYDEESESRDSLEENDDVDEADDMGEGGEPAL